jgi:hypothetical protein
MAAGEADCRGGRCIIAMPSWCAKSKNRGLASVTNASLAQIYGGPPLMSRARLCGMPPERGVNLAPGHTARPLRQGQRHGARVSRRQRAEPGAHPARRDHLHMLVWWHMPRRDWPYTFCERRQRGKVEDAREIVFT